MSNLTKGEIHMKRMVSILLVLVFIFLMAACGNNENQESQWGSFTAEKTYSYDEKFYAVQTIDKKDDASYIVVDIYMTENNEKMYSFSPARGSDFWGICWEEETYNIWIQSADIGVLCYEYQDYRWVLNENAVRPKEIISKYG